MDRDITLEELLQLWLDYTEFRKPMVSPSTYARDYAKITRRIYLMKRSAPDLDNARRIRDWLLQNYARETARRTLVQLAAAGRWAVFNDRLPWNPFDGLARYLTRRDVEEESCEAFTADERRAIIDAMSAESVKDSYWVRFLFATGCRPEEAAALRWYHVAKDFSQIHIREARPVDTGLTQATKTYRTTRFPCNERLQALLMELQFRPNVSESDYIFTNSNGGPFDYKNFQTRRWRPTLLRLVEEGKVAFYLPQYNCRHTFITEALKRIDVKDVSYLCRVSVATLMRVYASRSRKIIIPEF
ncbi:MAG: tyrosine-type recombinase/integrase [Leptolyngbya sp. SIO4C1]|nr:tyrosine-type recombinase/integrase [Leptolyngbya sp. SIO4C1]